MTFSDVPTAEVEEFWDRRPCNLRHSTAPVDSVQYSVEVTNRKYFVEPHIPKFACFEKWRGKRVLELGCGIGTDTIEFARHGAEVVAVDISKESLGVAKLRAIAMGVSDRIEFVHANIEQWPVTAPRLDLIYSFGVIHHTPHPERALKNIADIADPNTAVKLMLYNRLSCKALRLTHGKLWDDAAIARQSEAQSGSPVTYTYTPWGVRKMLERYLIVDHVGVDHIFPYKVDEYTNYVYKREWWARMPGFWLMEHAVGWHLLIDARGKP